MQSYGIASMSQVAQTILDQLGGAMFQTMVGVRRVGVTDSSLTVHIPTGTTKNKANRLRVTLMPSDTYTVEFLRVFGAKFTHVSTHEQIYAPDLRGLFETETGLRTSLTAIYG